MIVLNIEHLPKGCFECECQIPDHFDGNEWHYVCPFIEGIAPDKGIYGEVFNDGERHEKCPMIDELTEKEYELFVRRREMDRHFEAKKQWRKEHGIPEPKPNYDDFGTPACTEDGEYMLSR